LLYVQTFVNISQIRLNLKPIEKSIETGKEFRLLVHNMGVGTFISKTSQLKAVIDCREVLILDENNFETYIFT
jgi:hypothetical protein